MKIGELAKRTNLTTSTIRYYINQGLLLPTKVNGQHVFSENDVQELFYINMWKNMGFSIQEIENLASLKRLSNWVAIEDFMYYYSILEERKQALISDMKRIERQQKMVDDEMLSMQNNELHNWSNVQHPSKGFPLCCLPLFSCPVCGAPLYLNDAQMDYQSIDQCKLDCKCGYQATIEDGIVICKDHAFNDFEKPDLKRKKYHDLSQDLSILFQRTSNWLFPFLSHTDQRPHVIMETQLNSFFLLYPYLKSINSGETLILVDRFPELLALYKRNIERLDLNLNIIYLVNSDGHLPLRDSTVDVLIDYCSTNNYNLYSKEYYLPQYSRYLAEDGMVLGAYYYLENAPHSLRLLKNAYPHNHPDNYRSALLKKSIGSDYQVVKMQHIGSVTDSGNCIAFEFHQPGEKLCADCFVLEKKKS